MSQRLPSEVFVPPLPSFPVPVAPPEPTLEQVALCIPATWEAVVRGALQQLIQATTWQGTEEEVKAAQTEAATIIAQMTECSLEGEYPTPFWDDATDLNDQAPAEAQTWYGEVTDPEAAPASLTWQENASIWLITGFLAYSGDIGSAIFFNTIAPRFVLAFNKGDLREIWRIVVDAADVGVVDTDDYETDDIIEVNVVADQELATHDVYIIKQAVA